VIVGFTGTRKGLCGGQSAKILEFLIKNHVTEAHHGDCEGGDAQFHELCKMAGVAIIIHPPQDPKLRAFCKGADEIEPERPYLVRNHIIVDRCETLLAAPKELEEPEPGRGQGTWSTVRYARRSGRNLRIVWPTRRGTWG
jgi:hypothetical protein